MDKRNRRRRNPSPCVLCGENTYDWDHICRECRKLVKSGLEYEKARELKDEDCPISISLAWYWGFHQWMGDAENKNTAKEIKAAVLTLLDAVRGGNYPQASLGFHPREYSNSSVTHLAQTTPEKLRAAQDLIRAIRDIAARSYQDGLRRGKSFVRDLAEGNMTVRDMEEHF